MGNTHEYRCPICGGTLVWEYQTGEVTCMHCGLVVDRIYDYGPIHESEEVVERRKIEIKNHPKTNNRLTKTYRLHIKRYIMAQRYVKNKPWLEIDYDKVIETGKMIHTIKSKASIQAEKNIEEKRLWVPIKKGLEIIEKTYPVALARTSRSKYALAYMVYMYVNKNTIPSQHEILETFKISETSYKRLLKIVRKITVLVKPRLLKA